MSQTFIPGWETEITINTEDLTVIGNVIGFTRTRASNPKPIFGSDFRRENTGQGGGTLSANGHCSTEKITALEALYDSNVSVPYTLQMGTAGGDTDGGAWAGELVITELTYDVDAEGEWDWSINATLDGKPAYTPPV